MRSIQIRGVFIVANVYIYVNALFEESHFSQHMGAEKCDNNKE